MEATLEQQHNGSTQHQSADISAISPNGVAREDVSEVIEATNKGGRPSKYEPETIDRILQALADGLTQKQACIASGISENTLANWREQHPELEQRLTEAREQARQKGLAGIKSAGQAGDWRAWEAFLRLSFQSDYRTGGKVEVTANATAGNFPVLTVERQRELQAARKRFLEAK